MDALPTSATLPSSIRFHVGAPGLWKVERVPNLDPVEMGLARQQAHADALTCQSSLPILMVWRSQRALLVSRSDARLPRFEEARAQLHETGWPVLLRKSGGGAYPVGMTSVQVSMVEPASPAATMNEKYLALAQFIQSALRAYGITARPDFVAGACCPGRYDLAVDGRKIAGMSQHWFRNDRGVQCAITAASINVEELPDMLAHVVNQFYSVAGSPIRCQASALTNMRLEVKRDHLAKHDLTAALVERLGSQADHRS